MKSYGDWAAVPRATEGARDLEEGLKAIQLDLYAFDRSDVVNV